MFLPYLQIKSFFEFNDRLEAILTKAYIYRSASHCIGRVLIC